jgi:hypothetical protein
MVNLLSPLWDSYSRNIQPQIYSKKFKTNQNSISTLFNPKGVGSERAEQNVTVLLSTQSNVRLFQRTLNSVLLHKYLTLLFSLPGANSELSTGVLGGSLLTLFRTYFFESRSRLIGKTNLFSRDTLSYRIRMKFANLFLKKPFHVNVTM